MSTLARRETADAIEHAGAAGFFVKGTDTRRLMLLISQREIYGHVHDDWHRHAVEHGRREFPLTHHPSSSAADRSPHQRARARAGAMESVKASHSALHSRAPSLAPSDPRGSMNSMRSSRR